MTNTYGCIFVFLTSDSLNEPELQEQVEKLNRQNTEHTHGNTEADVQRGEDRGSGGRRQEPVELILDGPQTSATQPEEDRKKTTKEREEADEGGIFEDSEPEEEREKLEEKTADVIPEQTMSVNADIPVESCKTSLLKQERYLCGIKILIIMSFFLVAQVK